MKQIEYHSNTEGFNMTAGIVNHENTTYDFDMDKSGGALDELEKKRKEEKRKRRY